MTNCATTRTVSPPRPGSIIEYHEFVDARRRGDEAAAASKLAHIADYNHYDCTSTWRLRDWIRSIVPTMGSDGIGRRGPHRRGREVIGGRRARDGREPPGASPDRRAREPLSSRHMLCWPLRLASTEREKKPFWWAYFDRLTNPEDEWVETRGTLIADRVEVIEDWGTIGKEKKPGRTIRMLGTLEPGSTITPGASVRALYEPPVDGMKPPARATRAAANVQKVRSVDVVDGLDAVTIREKPAAPGGGHDQLPMGMFEYTFINDGSLIAAICEVAEHVLARDDLPAQPALDILARRSPRLSLGAFDGDVAAGTYVEAITQTLLNLDRSYVGVQGPPGTGKTYVGSRVVKKLVDEGWRIGVVAQSHAVVENFLHKVLDAGVDPSKVGKVSKDGDTTTPPWTKLELSEEVENFVGLAGCVLGGTAWTFTNTKRVERGALDLLIIDEAGQFSLANTIAVSVAARRLLLLGDPQQLPQVSQGTHPEPVATSALEWIADGNDTMPPERGFFLERTWRMHSRLTAVDSRLSYSGRLDSERDVTDARHLSGVEPGLHAIPVDHSGRDVCSPEEAAEVVRVVESLQDKTWRESKDEEPRPVTPADVIVVAPYNAQVAMIRQHLDEAGFSDTRVGTVDKFQGQEAPIVIVSMTSSSPSDVPRGMEFLLNRNRLNVAISRGQWAALLLHSPKLAEHLPSTPHSLAELGAFLSLVGAA